MTELPNLIRIHYINVVWQCVSGSALFVVCSCQYVTASMRLAMWPRESAN